MDFLAFNEISLHRKGNRTRLLKLNIQLSHELPNDVRARILENWEIPWNHWN